MNSSQLRQTINHYLDQLSGDRLCLVADFLNVLVHTEPQNQIQATEGNDFRLPSGDSLLSHTKTWEGSDFEECLDPDFSPLLSQSAKQRHTAIARMIL